MQGAIQEQARRAAEAHERLQQLTSTSEAQAIALREAEAKREADRAAIVQEAKRRLAVA